MQEGVEAESARLKSVVVEIPAENVDQKKGLSDYRITGNLPPNSDFRCRDWSARRSVASAGQCGGPYEPWTSGGDRGDRQVVQRGAIEFSAGLLVTDHLLPGRLRRATRSTALKDGRGAALQPREEPEVAVADAVARSPWRALLTSSPKCLTVGEQFAFYSSSMQEKWVKI